MEGVAPSSSDGVNAYEYSVWPAATNRRDSFIARRGWSLPFHERESGRATKRCLSQDRSDRVWYLTWASGRQRERLFAKLLDGLGMSRRMFLPPNSCTCGGEREVGENYIREGDGWLTRS